jgi:hypothetical protein
MAQEHPGDRALDICAALCRAFESSPGICEVLKMAGRLNEVLDELGTPAVRAWLRQIATDRIAVHAAKNLRREEVQIAKQMAEIDRRRHARVGQGPVQV